jgi:hypothetical protein
MLRRCYEELRKVPGEQFLENVLVESYLVHYRALLEFFCFDRRKYATTMLLTFSSEWATRTLSPAEIKSIRVIARPLSEKWFQLIGEQLAHCTHPRYKEKVYWPAVEMQTGMERVLEEFARINDQAPYR